MLPQCVRARAFRRVMMFYDYSKFLLAGTTKMAWASSKRQDNNSDITKIVLVTIWIPPDLCPLLHHCRRKEEMPRDEALRDFRYFEREYLEIHREECSEHWPERVTRVVCDMKCAGSIMTTKSICRTSNRSKIHHWSAAHGFQVNFSYS